VQDLLDQIVADSGDEAASYRTNARRWLNLARSYISDRGPWRSALVIDSFTTSAATTDGLYTLNGYDHISGQFLYDETNRRTIRQVSLTEILESDQDRTVTGMPAVWADAGSDTNGNKRIMLWQIPSDTFTIRFLGYKLLTDLTVGNDSLQVDPFFGPISPWAACMAAGMRYFHDLNNNEDVGQIQMQQVTFERHIGRRQAANKIAKTGGAGEPRPWYQKSPATHGLLDPAHYDNS
jgi:hypothetical protein